MEHDIFVGSAAQLVRNITRSQSTRDIILSNVIPLFPEVFENAPCRRTIAEREAPKYGIVKATTLATVATTSTACAAMNADKLAYALSFHWVRRYLYWGRGGVWDQPKQCGYLREVQGRTFA